MQSFYGDTEDSTEDNPGRRKSKLKSLKTRLLGRSKQGSEEGKAQLSQSASDITAGEGLGSEEDLACSQGMMGSRALSHDSIFLADEVQTDAEPGRVLSQENVHSKIKALQMKLQQQKMHLGPPPLVLPIRRPEDPGSRSEDDSLSHSPPENSRGDFITQAALSKTIYQPFSCPLSPKPPPTKSVPQTPFQSLSRSVPSNSVESPLDFSSPAQFTRCLDTSAARHRMSIKPRNQRASTKKKITAADSSPLLNTLNNIDHLEPMREEEQQLSTQEEVTQETEQGGPIIPITFQPFPPKSSEVAATTPKAASTSTNQTLPQQDQPVPGRVPSVPPQALRVKPHRPLDVMSSERPHSCFIPSELKDKREEGSEIQVMSHDKRTTPNKVGMTEVSSDQPSTNFDSVVAFRSSSVQQEIQDETESMRGIKRPAPGSGSFHFSITAAKNRDGERPRSGIFAEVLEQTEARQRAVDKPFSSTREKAEPRDSQPRGGPFAVGRLRQEGALHKSSVLPWDKRDSLKKVELVMPAKNVTIDTDAAKGEEVESSQEPVEDAVEAQEVEEDEGKTAFGIKLRSTSQSMRLRFDASSKHSSKPAVCEEPCDKQKKQETSDNASYVCQLPTSISCTTSTSGNLLLMAPSGLSHPIKQNPPTTCDLHIMPTEVQTTSSNPKEVETTFAAPQEPQPVHQPAPSEVSWMSLAMEKTRSLQQLFTIRFPRDFTGVQSAARPQAQVQTATQTETLTGAQIQTQTVKIQESTTSLEAANQPSTDAVKTETAQIRSLAQTVKPTLMVVQQKTSTVFPVQSNTSREPQASKQTSEPQSHPNTTQPASQSVPVQANPATSQSPSAQTSPQLAQGSATQSLAQSYLSSGQQQPPWSNRGLQLKSATPAPTSVSTTSSATAPPPVSASGREEREASMQEKESASLSGRRAVWAGSVSEKAAFLEKRAEWANPPGTKGVEVKKVRIEAQTSGESPAKTIPLSKDTNPEGGPGGKAAESSPTKVPDRPSEDRWLRKNVSSSSSPSSSPTLPSALASISDSGQPSWMELAKRKSMAWSDKSMD
ncbi:CRACD-like protein isoform X2 [Chaetodon trifascialis]|uniref:CRACD-like protein isoform X2 n=1 Tax=Chaetodon trifascialis TaxID=109706 RepID=UPI003996033C